MVGTRRRWTNGLKATLLFGISLGLALPAATAAAETLLIAATAVPEGFDGDALRPGTQNVGTPIFWKRKPLFWNETAEHLPFRKPFYGELRPFFWNLTLLVELDSLLSLGNLSSNKKGSSSKKRVFN